LAFFVSVGIVAECAILTVRRVAEHRSHPAERLRHIMLGGRWVVTIGAV